MNMRIGSKVPEFEADSFVNGAFSTVTNKDLLGKWSVVFFYPADFTFVCPTELADLAGRHGEFLREGAEIYAVSTDTHFAHKAWHDTSEAVGAVKFPMLGDPSGRISRGFGVLDEQTGLADRGTFVVSPEGVVACIEITSGGVGRDAGDVLRKLKAAAYVARYPGEVCPAKWVEGGSTLKPSLDLVGRI